MPGRGDADVHYEESVWMKVRCGKEVQHFTLGLCIGLLIEGCYEKLKRGCA